MSPFEPILQKHVWLQKIYDSACQRVLMNDEDKVAKKMVMLWVMIGKSMIV